MPSPPPTPQPAPVPVDNNNDVELTVEIQTDLYTKETAWTLEKLDKNSQPVELLASQDENVFQDPYQVYTSTIFLQQDECYLFSIYDGWEDGLTGGNGGYFKLIAATEVLINGSPETDFLGPTFTSRQVETICVPLSGEQISTKRDGLCPNGGVGFTVEIKTDLYTQETEWALEKLDKNLQPAGILVSEDPSMFTQPYTIYSTSMCLQEDECYRVTIQDKWGDGLTGGNGGYFKLLTDGTKVTMNGKLETEFRGSVFQFEDVIDVCVPLSRRRLTESDAPPSSIPNQAPTSVISTKNS